MQRQDLCPDLFLRRPLNALQHRVQHPLTLLLAALRVIHRRLREGKLALDVLKLLLTIAGIQTGGNALSERGKTIFRIRIAG